MSTAAPHAMFFNHGSLWTALNASNHLPAGIIATLYRWFSIFSTAPTHYDGILPTVGLRIIAGPDADLIETCCPIKADGRIVAALHFQEHLSSAGGFGPLQGGSQQRPAMTAATPVTNHAEGQNLPFTGSKATQNKAERRRRIAGFGGDQGENAGRGQQLCERRPVPAVRETPSVQGDQQIQGRDACRLDRPGRHRIVHWPVRSAIGTASGARR